MDYSASHIEVRLEKFKNIVQKYNIKYDYAFLLRTLEAFDITMIIDDSSSMRTLIIDYSRGNASPFDQFPTRWDELKQTVSIIVDLVSTLNSDGIDIYFLNRRPLLHVTDSSQLHNTFSQLPNGTTPISRVLSYVLNLKRYNIHDRKLLVLIATDGSPTDENGQNDLDGLERVLLYERYPSMDRMFVTFIACTDDLQTVRDLNEFDKKIPYVDVLDDYQSERAEVLAVQGKNFPFSYGDYVVKLLMGSINQWFDLLDEKKVKLTSSKTNRQQWALQQNSSVRRRSCTIS